MSKKSNLIEGESIILHESSVSRNTATAIYRYFYLEANHVHPRFFRYLGWTFQPFFRWWWAALTGVASILSLNWTPQNGLSVSGAGVAIIILGGSTLAFLSFSILVQGWQLYWNHMQPLEVVSIRRGGDFSVDWIFVVNGYLPDGNGTLIEVCRPLEDTEVPFAIIRTINTTERGYHQAVPVWMSSGYLRDFTQHKFEARSLRVKTTLTYDRILEAFNGQAK